MPTRYGGTVKSIRKPSALIVVGVVLGATLGTAGPAMAEPPEAISGATISPSSVEAGTPGHVFDITYQVSSSPFRGYASSQIPVGWARPQSSDAAAPGYVSAVPGSCMRVILADVSRSDTGPWTVTVEATCKAGQAFGLRYAGVTAPTAAGQSTFESGSMNSTSREMTVSPQPVVTVRPGPAATLAVAGFPSAVTAGDTGAVTA